MDDTNEKGKRSADEENAPENEAATKPKKQNRRPSKGSKKKALGSTVGVLHDRIDRFFSPEPSGALECKQSGLLPTDQPDFDQASSSSSSAHMPATARFLQHLYYFV